MRDIRGDRIAMIFQEPMTSLNPVFTDRRPAREAVLLHRGDARRGARARRSPCCAVGIPAPELAPRRLPPRAVRRDASARDDRDGARSEPDLLIADEPTTALDVTIQAQILELLARCSGARHGAVLITHNLGVVAQLPTGSS